MKPLHTAVQEFLSLQPKKNFIGGEWVDAKSSSTLEARDPGNGEVISHIADSDAADVDHAVAAAQQAFRKSGWATLPVNDRAVILQHPEHAVDVDGGEPDRVGDLLLRHRQLELLRRAETRRLAPRRELAEHVGGAAAGVAATDIEHPFAEDRGVDQEYRLAFVVLTWVARRYAPPEDRRERLRIKKAIGVTDENDILDPVELVVIVGVWSKRVGYIHFKDRRSCRL